MSALQFLFDETQETATFFKLQSQKFRQCVLLYFKGKNEAVHEFLYTCIAIAEGGKKYEKLSSFFEEESDPLEFEEGEEDYE